jgi:hypothetical protein
MALAGLIVGPVVASTFEKPRLLQFALEMLPFCVILALLGLSALWRTKAAGGRLAAALIMLCGVAQFAVYAMRTTAGPS